MKSQQKVQSRLGGVTLKILSKISGQTLVKTFEQLVTAQWLKSEELRLRNESRLRSLLTHASRNVPFYRCIYQQMGLAAGELGSVNDLSALPVLKKSDYRREYDAFNAENVAAYQRLERTTSGSTGEPFPFCLDRSAIPVIFASHLFYDSWHGMQPFDKLMRIASPPAAVSALPPNTPAKVRLRQALTQRIQNFYEKCTQEKIPLWAIDSERAEEIWKRIEAFRPKFVMGYTSSLATIADELIRRNLPLSRPVHGVITIAETLSPTRRRLIDQYFNAPIINRYGLREFGSWSAQSCQNSPDQLHINTELVVFELLRKDGSPCAAGEVGRVVLTDLYNYARPFIRYDTGDLAVAASAPCSCGRGFPLLDRIDGRSQECLRTSSGKEISPVVLGHYLFVYHDHLNFIRHYQLVQQGSGQIRFLVVPADAWTQERSERLRLDLVRLLGDDLQLTIEIVPYIKAETSGKRPIIKLVSPDDNAPAFNPSFE